MQTCLFNNDVPSPQEGVLVMRWMHQQLAAGTLYLPGKVAVAVPQRYALDVDGVAEFVLDAARAAWTRGYRRLRVNGCPNISGMGHSQALAFRKAEQHGMAILLP